eukprot:TRINITY_DN35061_c0_g1_i1.p1 TRINITY_DN35061_c0_g1~~TRINITY_DN35061_c0_g1_i1.p1  ORF type:complete len:324 (+),score=38.31 TRINITY_DN35061_c0_g1_i1:97-972(+)
MAMVSPYGAYPPTIGAYSGYGASKASYGYSAGALSPRVPMSVSSFARPVAQPVQIPAAASYQPYSPRGMPPQSMGRPVSPAVTRGYAVPLRRPLQASMVDPVQAPVSPRRSLAASTAASTAARPTLTVTSTAAAAPRRTIVQQTAAPQTSSSVQPQRTSVLIKPAISVSKAPPPGSVTPPAYCSLQLPAAASPSPSPVMRLAPPAPTTLAPPGHPGHGAAIRRVQFSHADGGDGMSSDEEQGPGQNYNFKPMVTVMASEWHTDSTIDEAQKKAALRLAAKLEARRGGGRRR